MLSQQVGDGLVHQLLQGGHAVAAKLLELMKGLVIKCDQLAHL